jgi:hypothetical protein
MCYGRHGIENDTINSVALRHFWVGHRYQGQCPERANNVFIGLDPNWDKNIDDGLLSLIRDYFDNLEGFWDDHQQHHHPLGVLLHGDGHHYHQNVRKLFNFKVGALNLPALKTLVMSTSFVELLGTPTYGRTTEHHDEYFGYLLDHNPATFDNITHLKNVIVRQVLSPFHALQRRKSVFVVGITTLNWLLELRAAPHLNGMLNFLDPLTDVPAQNENGEIAPIFETAGAIVYPMTHFSAAISDDHLHAVSHLLQL